MNASRRLSVALIACLPALAAAHPGHDASPGLVAGVLHPLLGIDHLLAAVLAGVWGAQRDGVGRIALPAGFLAAVAAGLLLAPVVPLAASATEQLMAASLLVSGLGLALAWRVPSTVCVALASGFAFFHGLAHGIERPAGTLITYGTGLLATTAVLLLAGLAGGVAARSRSAPALLRWAGFAGIAGGAALLG